MEIHEGSEDIGRNQKIWPWFFAIGLLNNAPFVLLNSVAKHIDPSSVGLVYLANSLPVIVVKFTGPYWFDHLTYYSRFALTAVLFAASMLIVSTALPSDEYSGQQANVGLALLGVCFSSIAGGIGEPNSLSLATILNDNELDANNVARSSTIFLTAFSSGTGLAGIAGYIWTLFFEDLMGLSSHASLRLGVIMPICFWLSYSTGLNSHVTSKTEPILSRQNGDSNDDSSMSESSSSKYEALNQDNTNGNGLNEEKIGFMRKKMLIYLFWYMIPLFTVYVAEYIMQSGVWAAMGFPVTSRASRDNFYFKSNFLYQVGVFCSRSSAVIFPLNYRQIVLIPIFQVVLLTFFLLEGVDHLVNRSAVLLFLSFVAGLFGGSVYVNAYILIAHDENIPSRLKEFSVAVASIADTLGIVVADIIGLYVQGCLYGRNNVTDFDTVPLFSCGYP